MKIHRRNFLHLAAGATALSAVSRSARAQTVVPKTGTRLITLGTQSGPPPRAHRAQSSNLLTVNGMHYIIDAGDGVARRLAKAGSTSATSELFSSPTIMMITLVDLAC